MFRSKRYANRVLRAAYKAVRLEGGDETSVNVIELEPGDYRAIWFSAGKWCYCSTPLNISREQYEAYFVRFRMRNGIYMGITGLNDRTLISAQEWTRKTNLQGVKP